jgi:lipid A ethanolaminephosphotransferase
MMKIRNFDITAPVLAWLTATFIVLADNRFFWGSLFKTVDISTWGGISFGLGVFAILVGIFSSIFLTFSARFIFKPTLIFILVFASAIGYFQTEYGVIVDKSMIQNVVETDYKEAAELVSFSLLFHLAVFGLLPALAVGFVRIRYRPFLKETVIRILSILGAILLAGFLIWANYKNFVLIGREHRELRLLVNPTAPLYEAYKFARNKLFTHDGRIQQIGLDARQRKSYLQAGQTSNKKTVVVLVVGETARAQSFSLNGYSRETNPQLAKDSVISFKNTYACGTSTAESVPCIFSHFGRTDYSSSTAGQYENVLDVLSHAGVHVLWRDNNSGCKGVCARVRMEDVSGPPVPELCNSEECFDEILLHQLRDRIGETNADMLIVLHQKGSHGPAYYKRYPKDFRRFNPECTDNAPQNCNRDALLNAYDNTILYTDHVLHNTIEFLKGISDKYNTVMIYASDHGESLGENGLYLHGLPYMLAPEEQRHIPMIAWVSDGYSESYQLSRECLMKQQDQPYSHDNISHSLLGLFGVETKLYLQDHDIFSNCMGGRENSSQR